MTARDLSHKQFLAALEREGFSPPRYLGYVSFDVPGRGRVSVSILNAGDRRRDQLRYLIKERRRIASS